MADELDELIEGEQPEDEIDFDDIADPEPAAAEPASVSSSSAANDELAQLRRERDEARAESARVIQEREAAEIQSDKDRRNNLQGNLNQWNSDANRLDSTIRELYTAFEIAKVEQDTAKMAELSKEYGEKTQQRNQLQQHINAASTQLNQPAKQPKVASDNKASSAPTLTESEKMAAKWIKENSWYNDPAHAAKRKLADEICAQAKKDNYDPADIKFWEHINREVEKGATTPRRTAPAVRPINTNGAQGKMTNNGNKADPTILKEAVKLLELRGIDTTNRADPETKRLLKSYYGTVKRNKDLLTKANA